MSLQTVHAGRAFWQVTLPGIIAVIADCAYSQSSGFTLVYKLCRYHRHLWGMDLILLPATTICTQAGICDSTTLIAIRLELVHTPIHARRAA